MPDGSYPNPKIVQAVMNCIDKLPIKQDEREGSEIENALDIYSEGNIGVGYNQCTQLAKDILNKWYRQTH